MRRKSRYIIRIEDESRLTDVAGWRFSRAGLALTLLMLVPAVLVVAGALIMITPLRFLLPGYMKSEERSYTESTLMRLDSLQEAHRRNEAYMNNFFTVLDTDRIPDDSVALVVNPHPLTVDSLLDTSEAERKFVKMMEEREKFNISILAPLAAESMIFYEPAEGGTFTSATRSSERAEVLVPAGGVVSAITDGTVVDMEYSPSGRGYTVVIQHGKGFVSRYSGLPLPLVGTGSKVSGGTAIATPARTPFRMGLRIWRNGDAVEPYGLLGKATCHPSAERAPVVDEDVGRGR